VQYSKQVCEAECAFALRAQGCSCTAERRLMVAGLEASLAEAKSCQAGRL